MYDERTAARFWAKVDKRGPDECWDWDAGMFREGYGAFVVEGRVQGAHRISHELASGSPIPAGMYVCHSCDRKKCVNPNHLWVGTPKQNTADMRQKGRGRDPRVLSGEESWSAKLTWAAVGEIREAKRRGVSTNDLMARFPNVSRRTINAAARGDTWQPR